jgi:hypothetical protein
MERKGRIGLFRRIGIGGKSGIGRILIAIGKIRADRAAHLFKNVGKEGKKKKIDKKTKRSDTLKEYNLAHRMGGKGTLGKPEGWR